MYSGSDIVTEVRIGPSTPKANGKSDVVVGRAHAAPVADIVDVAVDAVDAGTEHPVVVQQTDYISSLARILVNISYRQNLQPLS